VVIDHLLESQNRNTIGVAYVYCKLLAESGKLGVAKVLSIFAKQLIRQLLERPYIPSASQSKHRLPGDLYDMHKKRDAKVSKLSSLLSAILKQFHNTYIVIDALDEFPGVFDLDDLRLSLQKELLEIQQNAEKPVSILVTCRSNLEVITTQFTGATEMKIRAHPQDIRSYVQNGLKNATGPLLSCLTNDGGLQEAIQTQAAKAAQEL
jgi:hypothetical protein